MGEDVRSLLTLGYHLQTVQGRAQKPGLPQPGQAGGLGWGGTRSVHQSPPPPGPLSFVALGVGTDVTDEGEARAHLMWPLRLEPELVPCARAHRQHAHSVFSSLCSPFSLFAAASSEFPSWAPLTQLPLWEQCPSLAPGPPALPPPLHAGSPLVPRTHVRASLPPTVVLPLARSAVPLLTASRPGLQT